jgi:hypothetical protein
MRLLTFSFLFLTLNLAWATDSVITDFTATSLGDKAQLEWTSGLEGNLIKYKVERSTDNQYFITLTDILPEGNYHTYIYIDDDIMKSSSQRLYYYRIRMIFADGTFCYSLVRSVNIQLSGLMETWGSIKAMFR